MSLNKFDYLKLILIIFSISFFTWGIINTNGEIKLMSMVVAGVLMGWTSAHCKFWIILDELKDALEVKDDGGSQ